LKHYIKTTTGIANVHVWIYLLQYLELSNNRLTGLPEEVGQLTHLREICLSINQLDHIPPALASCCKLETILLANNKVICMMTQKRQNKGAVAIRKALVSLKIYVFSTYYLQI
jgi:hypothetical protein